MEQPFHIQRHWNSTVCYEHELMLLTFFCTILCIALLLTGYVHERAGVLYKVFSECLLVIFIVSSMSCPIRCHRKCNGGPRGPFCLPSAWHQELLPGQCGLFLHAAGGQRRQCEVMVPITHVDHVHHLRADRLHAAAQAGDGHPAVTGHALPWRRIRSPWRISWRLSPWLRVLNS